MALAVMEQVDLLEDSGTAVSRNLLDDFDRVFDLGVDVDAGLNRCISALAEFLASQVVKLLESVGRQRGGACGPLLLPSDLLGSFLMSREDRGF